MLRSTENLLMVGPNPILDGERCETCGTEGVVVWWAADAVRIRVKEDFEYKPKKGVRVLVCRGCADLIHAQWIVMPGEAPDA